MTELFYVTKKRIVLMVITPMIIVCAYSREAVSDTLNAKQSVQYKFFRKGNKGKKESGQVPEFEEDVTKLKGGDTNVVSRLILEGLAHKDADVFSLCFKALRDSNNEKIYEAIAKKVSSVQSPIALAACLNILQHSNNPKNWKVCLKHVDSPNRAVGHIATELAGQGVKEAVPKLIKNLKNVKMKRMTVTLLVLNRLIGKSFKLDPTYFENWWGDKTTQSEFKKTMRTPLERSGGVIDFNKEKKFTAGSYHGSKIEYANSMFSLDTSLSMKPDQEYPRPEPQTGKEYLKGELEAPFPPMPAGNGSKIWTARIALATAIKNLHRKMMFGVITFGGQIDAWKEAKLYPASVRKNLVDAYTWVLYDTPLTLGTFLYQSVEVATANDDIEVMYLLTDGAPARCKLNICENGSIPLTSDDEILKVKYFNHEYINHLAFRLYETKRVTVHTFLIGGSRGAEVLQSISEATHGDYKVIDMKKNKAKKDPQAKKKDKKES